MFDFRALGRRLTFLRIPAGLVIAAAITVAAAGQLGQTAPPARFAGAPLEASGVVAVPGSNSVLIVADSREHEVFWMPVDSTGASTAPLPVTIDSRIPDPEDITTDGRYFYVVGSQSRGGGRNTDGLVRFRFDPATRISGQLERVQGLQSLLNQRVPELGRLGRGRAGPLNIEGLTWDAARQRLLLGLRSPMLGRRALVVVARLTDTARPLSAANLNVESQLIPLDLGGLAIRGMGYDQTSSRVFIIGGGSTDEANSSYRLFDWDGAANSAVRDLGALRSAEKPEGVTRLTFGGKTRTLIVFDLGGYQFLD